MRELSIIDTEAGFKRDDHDDLDERNKHLVVTSPDRKSIPYSGMTETVYKAVRFKDGRGIIS